MTQPTVPRTSPTIPLVRSIVPVDDYGNAIYPWGAWIRVRGLEPFVETQEEAMH